MNCSTIPKSKEQMAFDTEQVPFPQNKEWSCILQNGWQPYETRVCLVFPEPNKYFHNVF